MFKKKLKFNFNNDYQMFLVNIILVLYISNLLYVSVYNFLYTCITEPLVAHISKICVHHETMKQLNLLNT